MQSITVHIVIKKKSGPDDGRGQTTLNSRRAREIMHQAQTVAYPHIFQGRHPVFDGRSNMYANFDVLSGSPGAQVSLPLSLQYSQQIVNVINDGNQALCKHESPASV